MGKTIITGSTALANHLGVHRNTIYAWKRDGVLQPSILAEFRKTVIYDLEKVYECLHHFPANDKRRVVI